MRTLPHDLLLSEIDEIKRILGALPKDAAIERLAFEKRLAAAEAELERLPSPEGARETLRLTFQGTPVVAGHGISARFAGSASSAFADAFAAILASNRKWPDRLKPIPSAERYPLMITGMAVGSFGFEIELPKNGELNGDEDGATHAIETLKGLLRASIEGSDQEFRREAEQIDQNAIRKLVRFLNVIIEHNAWCGLEFRGDYFRFSDADQVSKSKSRLQTITTISREKLRVSVSTAVLASGALILVGFLIYGVGTGDFSSFSAVWSTVSVAYGAIAGYYLRTTIREANSDQVRREE
ncbi:MAG: hypothetical protein QNJ09_00600 [Paracoccaceae bacterium]|nr:hypothetical protein [Paracoccaceae bacterium]